jgi:hypothetical protein
MAVLAADSTQPLPHRGTITTKELVCGVADIFYRGGLCWYLAAGGITPVAASGLPFAGICLEGSNGTTTSGTTRIKVATGGEFLILYQGTPALTDEGTLLDCDVSAASDNPADLILDSAGGTGDFPIGIIVEYVSATAGAWVNLNQIALAAAHA